MTVDQKDIRKILSKKIMQMNDIIADFDYLLTEMETEFYRVCIFGSARIKPASDLYDQVLLLAKELANLKVDIVTGGGPGLMEAANKGAKLNLTHNIRSIGLPIELPFESDANAHLDIKRQHRRFSSRLDEFMRISHAIIVTSGGLGTLLELFYTWQLIQVGHIKPRPLILLGKDMWSGLLEWIKDKPLAKNLMSEEDFKFVTLADTVDEVIEALKPRIHEFHKQK